MDAASASTALRSRCGVWHAAHDALHGSRAIPFFGRQLPALVGANEALAERTKEVHETLATVGYFLIGLHAIAALFHHYVQRDNTLRRMTLPH